MPTLSPRSAPNALDVASRTPLMWAATKGHASMVKLLLEHGANANQKTPSGWTALKYAEQEKHSEIVELLSKLAATPG